jgi:hypothetical protein
MSRYRKVRVGKGELRRRFKEAGLEEPEANGYTTKLRTYGDMLDRCLDRVTASLHAQLPELGRNVAIDGSDMPAYANGQRFVSKGGRERADSEFSDPDASLGAPLGRLDSQGRRLLRLQARYGRLHRNRSSPRLGSPHRPRQREHPRAPAHRHCARSRLRRGDGRDGQGLMT